MTSSLIKIEVGLLLALAVLGMGVAVQASEVTGQLSSGGAVAQTSSPNSGGGTVSQGSISGRVTGGEDSGGGSSGGNTSRNNGTTDTNTGSVLGASTGVENVGGERFVRTDTYLTDGTNLALTETVEAAEVDSQELALADTSLMSSGLWLWLLLLLLVTAGAGYYYYVHRHRKEAAYSDQI